MDRILICPPTYGMYAVCAQVNDVEVVKVPLDSQFQLQVSLIEGAVRQDPNIKIIFVCSPGNPTGTLISIEDIRRVLTLDAFKGVVVVDEAYIDFCGDDSDGSFNTASVAPWISEFPNLIVTQTLSKAFGLAGIRLGISIASAEVAQIFNNTKAPYNISTPTSLLGRSALSPQGIQCMSKNVNQIKQQRTILLDQFKTIKRLGKVLGTNDANFILVQVLNGDRVADNNAALSIYKRLAEVEGVVVRFRGTEPGCLGCLRITVGTGDENKVLVQKLNELLS